MGYGTKLMIWSNFIQANWNKREVIIILCNFADKMMIKIYNAKMYDVKVKFKFKVKVKVKVKFADILWIVLQ